MPASADHLRRRLHELDGENYKSYRTLQREDGYGLGARQAWTMHVNHVQPDPFAPPSRLSVHVPVADLNLPAELQLMDSLHRRAICHGVAESVAAVIDSGSAESGSANSGSGFGIDRPGQQILDRSCVQISSEILFLRLTAQLPARGRRILGHEVARMLCDRLPALVQMALHPPHLDTDRLAKLIRTVTDAGVLRQQLKERELVAFVADGSQLARRSGVDDRPLTDGITWSSPTSLRVTLRRADDTPIQGTGIPHGVTVIVGGGFHGKSTLLNALRLGVYDHVPGDGREYVVSDASAVALRAEDGRCVSGVDLSPFIGDLPFGQRTDCFNTADASGATSQAAATIEALELGCRVLLIDEDTAATNFMIRDGRMRQLISPDREPITPFIDRVRQLSAAGVSTILVTGGSSDFLGVADTVIAMHEYQADDLSTQAHELVPPVASTQEAFPTTRRRTPMPDSIDPRRGRRERVVSARGRHRVDIGQTRLDLQALTQLVDDSQTRALAHALLHLHGERMDGTRDLATLCCDLEQAVGEEGLDILAPGRHYGDLAGFRRFELGAALNRLRTLQININIDNSSGATV